MNELCFLCGRDLRKYSGPCDASECPNLVRRGELLGQAIGADNRSPLRRQLDYEEDLRKQSTFRSRIMRTFLTAVWLGFITILVWGVASS